MNILVAHPGRQRSLTAMWQALHAARSSDGELSYLDFTGNLVQTLDYYLYGASRVSTATSTNEKRKYIGQFSDDSSGLDYLMARYYDSSRGQFLSQDPVFVQIGDPSRVKQLTQLDQLQFLSNPQQLNVYGYSKDNPITNKDPNGLWALKLGVTGTFWGGTGSAGIYVDLGGIDYYTSTGFAAGAQGGVEAGITSADLQHTYSITTSAFATGGDVVVGQISKNMTYYPYTKKPPQSSQDVSIGLGGGLSGGVTGEVSGPLITWPTFQRSSQITSGPQSTLQSINSSRLYSAGQQTNSPQSMNQVLSNLQSALRQLSGILSAQSSKTSKTN